VRSRSGEDGCELGFIDPSSWKKKKKKKERERGTLDQAVRGARCGGRRARSKLTFHLSDRDHDRQALRHHRQLLLSLLDALPSHRRLHIRLSREQQRHELVEDHRKAEVEVVEELDLLMLGALGEKVGEETERVRVGVSGRGLKGGGECLEGIWGWEDVEGELEDEKDRKGEVSPLQRSSSTDSTLALRTKG
jgi:hypothetical protein